jgi:hypothetical protein
MGSMVQSTNTKDKTTAAQSFVERSMERRYGAAMKRMEPNERTALLSRASDKTFAIGPARSVQFFVRTVSGKSMAFLFNPSDTIASVKKQLYIREGYPPKTQRLIHAGRQLEDGIALGDYDISKDSTIFLVLSLRGGGEKCKLFPFAPRSGNETLFPSPIFSR